MNHDLDNTIALLAHTPAALDALLRGLPEYWIRSDEGENTWSPFRVVGHLNHAEIADWIPRAQMILQFGESKTFEPFDREGYARAVEGKSLAQLLDQFARLRTANLEKLRAFNLRPEDLERRGRHPVFGPVTLSQLLATWATHDLTHLHQLSRVLAHQYRDAVGPWSVFLGVLKCDAHSAPG